MKAKTNKKSISNISLFSTLALITGSLLVCGINASALSYQTSTDVSFTFNPFINVSVSSDLVISNLNPGSYADSSIITVGVSTNTTNGYILQTTAGTNSTNNRLVNEDNSSYYFSSLGTNETVASMNNASDNTWGYSYSVDNGTNWISSPGNSGYSGLPQDANTNANERGKGGKTLLDTEGTPGDRSVQFKIGAKAASTQAAGEYTNIINFYAVGYPAPKDISTATTMQEVEVCPASLTTGQIYTIEDSRDNQNYKVARLADGKCWMVENLNLAGGTAISAETSDVDSSYISSFTTGGNLTKDGANNTIVLPASDASNFDTNNYSFIYNSGNKTNCGASGQNTPCYSYYSWDAATLGSGRTLNTVDVDAPYSICPKGWKLPTSRSTVSGGSDFYQLAVAYGMDNNLISQSTSDFYNNAGPGTTVNYILPGNYHDSLFENAGSSGSSWSSTSYTGTSSYDLYYTSNVIVSANITNRKYGVPVRCLFSE